MFKMRGKNYGIAIGKKTQQAKMIGNGTIEWAGG
jgi:hypothetical protein